MFLSISVSTFLGSSTKTIIPCSLEKFKYVPKKTQKIYQKMYSKRGKKMEKNIVELGTCHLVFAKRTSCWSFLGVASSIV